MPDLEFNLTTLFIIFILALVATRMVITALMLALKLCRMLNFGNFFDRR